MTNPDPELRIDNLSVMTHIVDGKYTGPFTNTCPECGDHVDDITDTEHVVVTLTGDVTAIVVGCEGYFVIDPNLVGIDSDTWQDWRKLPEIDSTDVSGPEWDRPVTMD
jgi:hypothetical protein